MSLSSRSCCCW